MSCSTEQYFWSGNDFSTAPQLYTDPELTIVADNGWYSIGGVYREMLLGVLQSAVPCPSCVIPCGDPFDFGSGSTGRYTILFDMGNIPGAAIITFSPGKTGSFPMPDMCTWSYNGITASEYSSLLGGYQTGMIGAPDGPPNSTLACDLLVTTGSTGVNPVGVDYSWNPSTSMFVAGGSIVMGSLVNPTGYSGISNNIGEFQSTLLDWNCADLSSGSIKCTGGGLNVPPSPYISTLPIAPNLRPFGSSWPEPGFEYRGETMVVPSPPGTSSTILTVVVDAPCGSTWWGIDVQCPRELTAIQGSSSLPLGTPMATVCGLTVNTPYYHVPVDAFGNSNMNSSYNVSGNQFPSSGKNGQADGVLGLNDWIFTDPYGENALANGVYKMSFDADDGNGLQDWAVEVGVLEYKDSATYAPQTNPHALPPEDYINDPATQTYGVQSTGTRIPGIVKSITPCL